MKDSLLTLSIVGLLLILLTRCGEPPKANDEFRVEGHVKGLEGKALQLEKLVGVHAEPVKEVEVDEKGNFQFAAKGEENAIFQLRMEKGGRMLFIPDFNTLHVEADVDELEAFQVTGSPKSRQLRDFNLQQYRLYIDFVAAESRLNGLDREKDTTAWHELEAVTDKAMMAYRDYLRGVCDTVSLPVLRAHAALSLTVNGNYHYLQKIVTRLEKEMPGSAAVGALRNELGKEADRRVGQVASNITGKDIKGRPFDLATLRGKVVLLQFWASYCEFSRAENARLAGLSQFFADHHVALVCFSIDDHDADWRAYLQTANLDWAIHLRGINGTQSTEISQYLVKAIPANYVIDANGVIRDLDIRANELEADLPGLATQLSAHP